MANWSPRARSAYLELSEVTGDELRQPTPSIKSRRAAVRGKWSLFSLDVERSAVPASAELGGKPLSRTRRWAGTLPTRDSFRTRRNSVPGDFRLHQPRFNRRERPSQRQLLGPDQRQRPTA